MLFLYVGLLAIYGVYGQVPNHSPISFTNVSSIIHWGSELQQNNIQRTIDNYEEILMQMKKSSDELYDLESRINITLTDIFNHLLDYMTIDFSVWNLKTNIEYSFSRIDEIFEDTLIYEFSGKYGNDELRRFIDTKLHGNENVFYLLKTIHDAFTPDSEIDPFLTIKRRTRNPGFLSVLLNNVMEQTSSYYCSKDLSMQQRIYYIFVKLIISEMKGLAILTHIYTRQWLLTDVLVTEPYNYMNELTARKQSFEYWINKYYNLVRNKIESFSDQFILCHGTDLKRDADYIELTNFSRAQILSEYVPNYRGCLSCPIRSDLVKISQSIGGTIYNCNEMSPSALACRPGNDSSRDYLWWKLENGTYYGHNTTCAHNSFIFAGIIPQSIYTMNITPCRLCVCSVDQNRSNNTNSFKVWRISVADQISDIWNNKVVTGVRFVTRNNTIHLQIQEGKFLSDGASHGERTWKELNYSYIDQLTIIKQSTLDFVPLSYDRKSMVLDYVKVWQGYAVTGVRLQVTADSKGFILQVYGTKFNFDTGYLNPFDSSWFQSQSNLYRQYATNYRDRMKIKPIHPDDPTRSPFLEYYDAPTSVINFTHTDLQKDAGQTTIPFFDARPVVTVPSFPLHGVGLFYKGRHGFGGFIAPKIYTIDLSNSMNGNVREINKLIDNHFIERQMTGTSSIKFNNVNTIIRWSSEIYNILTNEIMNNSQKKKKKKTKHILNQMQNFCYQLNNLETQMNINLDLMLHTLMDNFIIEHRIEIMNSELTNYVHLLNKFYNDTMTYIFSKTFNKDKVDKFTDSVLQGENNLPDVLLAMAEVFMPGANRDPFTIIKRRDVHPGFLSVVLLNIKEYMNRISLHCNKYVSSQQRMYYIFIKLIMSDMKGFATLMLIHAQKLLVNQKFSGIPYNYHVVFETEIAHFEKRMKNYYKVFKDEINKFSRYFRQCRRISPKPNVDFIELQKFSHAKIFDDKVLEHKHCRECPNESDLDDLSRRTHSKLYNCTAVEQRIVTCLAEDNSDRDYLWWEYETGDIDSYKRSCTKKKYILPHTKLTGPMFLRTYFYETCVLCICTADQNWLYYTDNPEIWRISVTEQISNIWSNKVVTGVRFISNENTIHIQIQEGNFSREGLIYSDTAWKKLDTQYIPYSTVKITSKIHYEFLRHDRKSLNLDHVQVPDDYTITGVRFKVAPNGALALHVHGTSFNFHTGQLNSMKSQWFEAERTFGDIDEYAERSDITPTNPDHPVKAAFSEYNDESNKMISFKHTNLKKDAGQTTVPFFDMQPVVTQPPFPLSGVQLCYRGQPGYGGFILLQIHTIEIGRYLNENL